MSGLPGPGDDRAEKAAAIVRSRTDLIPRVGIVLGSGLGPALEDELRPEAELRFVDLPGFPPPSVPGHGGRLLLGNLAGVAVVAFSGRVHFYEGHGMDVPVLLPRLARELGATTMILTAAVGGLVEHLETGTLIVVTDHVNLMGTSPLLGWRRPDGVPAFVSAQEVYDRQLAELALERAADLGIRASVGVYAAMSGPAYETPAEVAMLRMLGASVVGMSMVPESLPAHALGMRVLGLCALTNALGSHVSHEEVVHVSNETATALGRLLVDLLPRLPVDRSKES